MKPRTQEHRSAGAQKSRNPGIQEARQHGIQERGPGTQTAKNWPGKLFDRSVGYLVGQLVTTSEGLKASIVLIWAACGCRKGSQRALGEVL